MRFGVIAGAAVAGAMLLGGASAAGFVGSTIAALGAAACAVALLAVVAWGSADPGLRLFGPAITAADTGRSEVALTFDDGPHPESTPALLDALGRAGARATFFVLVDAAERHPELLRALAASHEIGLHGLAHTPWLTLRSPAAGAAELREACARLEAITGAPVRWYRPPFGAISPRMTASVARAGLTLVWCSVRTRDGGRLSEEAVRTRCASAGPGDVVLLHEGRDATTRALPGILEDLGRRGLTAVTVGELCASR